MSRGALIKDTRFEAVADVKVDAKRRVSLGPRLPHPASNYKIYCNALGQILLDPMATVPAHEAWLFAHPDAARKVREGLDDARRHRLVKAKEDYTRALHDPA